MVVYKHMSKSVYIAGPMTGIESFNFPAFFAAEEKLHKQDYFPIYNPAQHDLDMGGVIQNDQGDYVSHESFNLADALLWDLARVAEVDTVYVLPNWEHSKGVAAELALAKALGKEIIYEVPPFPFVPATNTWESYLTPLPAGHNATLLKELSEKLNAEVMDGGAVKVTSSTGGQKGSKLARFDLIPVTPLTMLAELYGKGAEKYDDDNWRKGYDWKLSYAAMQRHLNQFWGGEDLDPEMQLPHLVNAAWHCFTLTEYLTHPELYAQFDGRVKGAAKLEPDMGDVLDVLDRVRVELQSADSSTTKEEFMHHLVRIQELVGE